jgi:flagellar motor switch protein FliN
MDLALLHKVMLMDTETSKAPPKQDHTSKASNVFSSIPVTVEVMLGTSTLQLSDLMGLAPGSDVTLDQAIGEPVTVIVNGKKIAKGELYVLETQGDLLGVRITEILSSDIG